MREKLTVTRTLASPPQAVWQVISAGTRVERWFEWVAETVLKDAAEGGLRIIRMKDGTSFDEYITLNDARTWTYQYYAADPPLPVKHVLGTQRIEATASRAVLSWSVTFDRTAGAPADIVATLRDLYAGALARIDELGSQH